MRFSVLIVLASIGATLCAPITKGTLGEITELGQLGESSSAVGIVHGRLTSAREFEADNYGSGNLGEASSGAIAIGEDFLGLEDSKIFV